MKRALALGLAAMMAASTLTVTVADAKPKGWQGNKNWNQSYNHKKKYKKKYYKNDYNPVAPFLFGSIVGLAIGSAITAPPPAYAAPYPYPAYGPDYYGNPHVQWCLAHYPNTYNPQTNMYYVRVGVPAVCISPYSY